MLRLLAYDIADPRRLHRVAEACLDFGVRIQRSLFECWLDDAALERLWSRLEQEIEPSEDRIVVFTLDAPAAARRRTLGTQMEVTEERTLYLI